jgi:borealin
MSIESIHKIPGYLTEEASQKSFRSGRSTATTTASYQNVSIVAPLQTLKSRRRSKSVSSMTSHTPGPRAMMSAQKATAPRTATGHLSRAKYRTPINASGVLQRPKAASADRVNTITPKGNPSNPFSILRHARAGEAVFSVSGSPVVPTNVCEPTANVNIPVADGILSIRPQSIDPSHIDPQWLGKIDSNTINHLRTLKQNLDLIMRRFDRK